MVQYITYKEKQYPVRLSYRVFKGLKKDLGKVNLKDLESLDPDLLEAMMWHGLVVGHRFTGETLELKRQDMEDVLDECMFEFIELVPIFFPKKEEGKLVPNLNTPLPGGEKEERS